MILYLLSLRFWSRS